MLVGMKSCVSWDLSRVIVRLLIVLLVAKWMWNMLILSVIVQQCSSRTLLLLCRGRWTVVVVLRPTLMRMLPFLAKNSYLVGGQVVVSLLVVVGLTAGSSM